MINFEILHTVELELIRLLHTIRTPLLDSVLKLFDFFDRQEFFFILIPVIWFCHGWKHGARLLYILLLSTFTNHVLKEYFLLPRPFHLDPSLGIMHVSGYGFPSGAAQSVVLLSGILLSSWKSVWSWAAALLYVALVSFSRVYLGVHFPSDILAGWLVGLGLWAFFNYLQPQIEHWIEQCLQYISARALFLISQLLALSFLLFNPSIQLLRVAATFMGMCVGIFFNHVYQLHLKLPSTRSEYVARGLLGVAGTFLFYKLTLLYSFESAELTAFARFLSMGLWVSFGCNLLLKIRDLKNRRNFMLYGLSHKCRSKISAESQSGGDAEKQQSN
jgi:undecaprenyl-diphosphatase